MDFALDARTQELRETLLAFMDEDVYPAEPFHARASRPTRDRPWALPPMIEGLKAEARKRGLWNLFLPGRGGRRAHQPAVRAAGRDHRAAASSIAPVALNCAAPDTGNMEVLHEFGTDEQKKQWLEPLLAGEIRSSFAMTEPDVASVRRDQHRDLDRARR